MNLRAAWYFFKMTCRHKYEVSKACRILGVPLWQRIMHDLSKFHPSEFIPYANFFDPALDSANRPAAVVEAFKRAVRLHKSRNPHHHEYWRINIGEPLHLPVAAHFHAAMPREFAREMVADWMGAAATYSNNQPKTMAEFQWWLSNRNHMFDSMHPVSRRHVARAIYDWFEYCDMEYDNPGADDEFATRQIAFENDMLVEWAFGLDPRQPVTHD